MLSRLLAYVANVFRRRRIDAEVQDEVRFHLEHEIEANIGRGMSPDAARRAALRDLGGVPQTIESVRDVHRTWVDVVWCDTRCAWRGVRSRGWRAGLVVALLGVTLAANAVTFSVVDALVLHPHPYPGSDRIVFLNHTISEGGGTPSLRAAALYREWREQEDLFEAVGGYLSKSVFLTDRGTTELVNALDVTVDFFQVLGVSPRWGRAFTAADVTDTGAFAAMISESLARDRFGTPLRAVGQRLSATGRPLVVVGVMPSTFSFPNAKTHVWRAMDPTGPLTENTVGPILLARAAHGVPLDSLTPLVAQRSRSIGQAVALTRYAAEATPYFPQRQEPSSQRTILFVLLGSALSLLVASCGNIASLELATALARVRTHAVQLALGASRSALLRVAALEGAILISASFVVSIGLTWIAFSVVVRVLPEALRVYTQNPIDLDNRVLWFTIGLAGTAWLLATIVPVLGFSRPSLASLVTSGGRASWTRRSVRARNLLTVIEVGLAVAIVVVGGLCIRTYRALSDLDRGFETAGVATLEADVPAYYFRSRADGVAFTDRFLAGLRDVPGVLAATRSAPPPAIGDSPSRTTLEVDGTVIATDVLLGRKWIDTSYFQVTSLPLLRGRYLKDGDAPAHVVISESFARKFWPNGDAVGRSFRGTGSFKDLATVVGVVADFRTEPRRMPLPTDTRLYIYVLWGPPSVPSAPASAPPAEPPFDGGSFRAFLTYTVRMDDPSRATDVDAAAKRLEPGLRFAMTFVDHLYERQNEDVLLATRVVSTFGVVAFLVAMAGLYGVMQFLVVSRTREIGIRMALGARQRDISRLVVFWSGRLVVLGVILGTVAAFMIAKSIESQLFGVLPSDAPTYAVVVLLVTVSTLMASWRPAIRAARVDPATTLRAE